MRRAKKAIMTQTYLVNPGVAGPTDEQFDGLAPVHWINPATERYYAARLVLNLFGQWELQQAWGSLNSRRGRLCYQPLSSLVEGQCQLAALARRRAQRGYMIQPIILTTLGLS